MDKLYRFLKILIVALAAAVVVLGIGRLSGGTEPEVQPTVETTVAAEPGPTEETTAASYAPEFTMYDRQGNAVRFTDFLGKPVILNFWASWCGPCKSEMPELEAAYREYGDQIQFLMVDLSDGVQETVEKAAGYIDEQGYTFPVYFDSDMEGASTYGVTGIPVTFFIDAEGVFVAYYQGAMSGEILRQGVDMLLAEL